LLFFLFCIIIISGDQSVASRLDELRQRLLDVQSTIAEIRSQMAFSRGNTAIGLGNVTEAEFAIQRSRDALKVAINTVLNSLQF